MQAEPGLEQAIASCLPFHASIGAVRAAQGSVPPDEAESLPATWSEKRAREHWAGRRAAARALARFGLSEPVGRADDGVPLFPRGIAGSIAHTGGRSVVGVCITTELAGSVGIDIEGRQSLAPELIERIVDAEEKLALAGLSADTGAAALWAFCAKEAYYKCVFPTHRRFLGFLDVTFGCDLPSDSDDAYPNGPNPAYRNCRLGERALGDSLSGRLVLTDEFVVSIVWRSD